MMKRTGHRARPAWENRYERPDEVALLGVFDAVQKTLVQSARGALSGVAGLEESIRWAGIPWRWCFWYGERGSERGRAYLVPRPGRPTLAVPLMADAVERIEPKRLSKGVREAIVHAPVVEGVRWAEWELSSRSLVDEVVGLVEMSLGVSAGV